jgi:hypothetical protein
MISDDKIKETINKENLDLKILKRKIMLMNSKKMLCMKMAKKSLLILI